MNDVRAQLVTAAAATASRIAAVLDQNPVRGAGPFPIGEVHRALAEQQAELQRAVRDHPQPLSVDGGGRPDKLGSELAALMGYLQHVLVFYHGLDDLPGHMRTQAHRDLSATHQRARKVRALR